MKFNLFGFPIRVEFSFLIILVLLGQGEINAGRTDVFLYKSLIIFISILIHELGHALCFRRFKIESSITLHSFGGHCIPRGGMLKHLQNMQVSLAGPLAGFVLALVCFAADRILVLGAQNVLAAELLTYIYWVNIGWGVFNLLPLLPMDGAQALRSFLKHFRIKRAEGISFFFSFLMLGAFAMLALYTQSIFNVILVGMFAYENYQMWERSRQKLKGL